MKAASETAVGKRRYRMVRRAEQTAATRRAIADAWLELFLELHYDEITLDLVALRAKTTVQTVIRQFGSKEELFATVAREIAAEEAIRRSKSVEGDVRDAVRTVIGHYERIGDAVLRLLAQEDRLAAIGEIANAGRQLHYDWVERAFSPFLQASAPADRRRRRAQLIVLTDVYCWRLFRRDLGFSRRQTELAMTEMVEGLLNGGK